MPDLLGPNPCDKCNHWMTLDGFSGKREFCDVFSWPESLAVGCPKRVSYSARRELLEALKAGGSARPAPVTGRCGS